MDNKVKNVREGVCCFNKVVDCTESKCRVCGWNPAVAADRIEDWEMERRLAGKK